jgi:inhibitor of KinA sporulation pathway (predicted exonuclease)
MSNSKTILVIDIEATCWEHLPPNKFAESRNEIIEIGITPIDIATCSLGPSRSIICLPPTTEISDFCTKLTTLTPDFVEFHGIPFADAIKILKEEYKAHRNVFASWGDYDRRSFEKNCRWNNVEYPFSNLHLNVKALFAATYGHSGGMSKCCAELGIKLEGTHHRGIDDSRNIAKILLQLLPEP